MSNLICVKAIPIEWSTDHMVKELKRLIDDDFQLFDFRSTFCGSNIYIKVPADRDRTVYSARIRSAMQEGIILFTSYVKNPPELMMSGPKIKKSQRIQAWHNIFISTHTELLKELQRKYMALNDMSENVKDLLFESMGWTIFGRLKTIMESNPGVAMNDYFLSEQYRKAYPHLGDFEFVLSSLHAAEDMAGVPRSEMEECELMYVRHQAYMVNKVPYKTVRETYAKHCERINKKISVRLNSLNTYIDSANPTKEEIARKKVREALKKLAPALSSMTKQVVLKNIIPRRTRMIALFLYGERGLPVGPVPTPMRRLSQSTLIPLRHLHYAAQVRVRRKWYEELMMLDGAICDGTPLIVRPDIGGIYCTSTSMEDAIREFFGVPVTEY